MAHGFQFSGDPRHSDVAGAMLAIGVILGGHWKSLPAKEFLDAFSANVPFIMPAIPIVLLPCRATIGANTLR